MTVKTRFWHKITPQAKDARWKVGNGWRMCDVRCLEPLRMSCHTNYINLFDHSTVFHHRHGNFRLFRFEINSNKRINANREWQTKEMAIMAHSDGGRWLSHTHTRNLIENNNINECSVIIENCFYISKMNFHCQQYARASEIRAAVAAVCVCVWNADDHHSNVMKA